MFILKSFGTSFILASDVYQKLPEKIFQGGPWFHMATVKHGLQEYVCFEHGPTHNVYIEEITNTGNFKQIQDDELFKSLIHFLVDGGIIATKINKEFKIAKTTH